MVLKQSQAYNHELLLPNIKLYDPRQDLNIEIEGEVVIIAVICNHCPYVLHIKQVMTNVLNDAIAQGFAVYAISGNDPKAYPADAPEHMVGFGKDFAFPYLYDAKQGFLQAIAAECTPEFYIFKDKKLKYHGRFDGSSPGNGQPVTGIELVKAIAAVANEELPQCQLPSQGCSIKWL